MEILLDGLMAIGIGSGVGLTFGVLWGLLRLHS